MGFFLVLVLFVLGWFLYRVFISGSGGGRSFVQFYRDQNEVRNDIQQRGGIHNVESENIEQLKNKGYKVSEYGENFVKMSMENKHGKSDISIIHGKDGKSLEIELYDKSGSEVFRSKSRMRSSNGAIDTLNRIVKSYVDRSDSTNKSDKRKLLSHFDSI